MEDGEIAEMDGSPPTCELEPQTLDSPDDQVVNLDDSDLVVIPSEPLNVECQIKTPKNKKKRKKKSKSAECKVPSEEKKQRVEIFGGEVEKQANADKVAPAVEPTKPDIQGEKTETPVVEEDDRDARTLFVGNIAEKVTEDLLYELMLQAGPIEEVRIPKDRETQKQKSFGFVLFKYRCAVEYAW